jgi:hypothetical protein
MGEWDEGHHNNRTGRADNLIRTDRKGRCFYLEYREGMLFPAGQELHLCYEEIDRLKRKNVTLMIGLCVLTGVLVVDLALRLVGWLF